MKLSICLSPLLIIAACSTPAHQGAITPGDEANGSSGASLEKEPDLTEDEVRAFAVDFHAGLVGFEAGAEVFRQGISSDTRSFNAGFSNELRFNADGINPADFWEDEVTCEVVGVHIYGSVASVFGIVTYTDYEMSWSKRFHGTVIRENDRLVWHRWMEVPDTILANNYLGFYTEKPEAGQAYFRLAWAVINGKFDEAYEFGEEAIKEDPGLAMAYIGRAWKSFLLGSEEGWDKAMAEAVAQLDEESYAQKLFVRSMASKDVGEQRSLAREALTLAPDDPLLGLWYVFVTAFVGEDADVEAGLRHARLMLKRWPVSGGIHNSMGYLLMRAGRMQEAERHFKMYLRLEPETANAHDSWGDYLSAAGKEEEAKAAKSKAAELSALFSERYKD